MIFKLACGDVMPGCAAHFESSDRDQLLRDVSSHAASAHGITSITPGLLTTLEGKIAVAA